MVHAVHGGLPPIRTGTGTTAATTTTFTGDATTADATAATTATATATVTATTTDDGAGCHFVALVTTPRKGVKMTGKGVLESYR